MRVFFFGLIFLTSPIIRGQDVSRTVLDGKVGPYEAVSTTKFDLTAWESLSIEIAAPAGRPHLLVSLFTSESLLLAKREANDMSRFNWSEPTRGTYYLLLCNTTGSTVSYKVSGTVMEPDKGRGSVATPIPDNFAEMQVFYATNRKATGNRSYESYFGTDPEDTEKLNYGEVKVSLPRDLKHTMGELEGPAVFRIFNIDFGPKPDPRSQFLITDLIPSDQQAFWRQVRGRVTISKAKSAVVFIHGFNVSFEEAACRTAQLAYDLVYDGAPIVFSWPSQGKPRVTKNVPTLTEFLRAMIPSLQDYIKDGEMNELSAPLLSKFLMDLRTQTGAQHIQIIAHSMGNRLLLGALSDLAKRGVTSAGAPTTEVAFMAPDVSNRIFEIRIPNSIRAASRVTLYASSTDRALQAAQKLSGESRAGQGGPRILVLPGIDSIDASGVDTGILGLNHGYYGDRASIIYDLNQLIHGIPASQRIDLHKSKSLKGTYWKFGRIHD